MPAADPNAPHPVPRSDWVEDLAVLTVYLIAVLIPVGIFALLVII